MTALSDSFNRSSFGRFLNSPEGRVFRATAGAGFLAVGLRTRQTAAGKASIVWGVLPLTAGLFDVCFYSVALGGPFRGSECRAIAEQSVQPGTRAHA